MTKSQIDKLGERLRRGEHGGETDSMLEALYDAYEPIGIKIGDIVAEAAPDISSEANEWTGPDSQPATFSRRPTKSEASIVAKLWREKTRLSTMQDIVGGRLVVDNLGEQELFLWWLTRLNTGHAASLSQGFRERADQLREEFGLPAPAYMTSPFMKTSITDRIAAPRYGYRAVHVIVLDYGIPYEIQIRTELQNRWAQLAERLNDRIPGVKYGEGPEEIRRSLNALSEQTYRVERDNLETLELNGPEIEHRIYLRQRDRYEASLFELSRAYGEFEEMVASAFGDPDR